MDVGDVDAGDKGAGGVEAGGDVPAGTAPSRRRRWPWLVGLVALLVIAAAVVWLIWTPTRPHGDATRPVRALFAALAAHDATAAAAAAGGPASLPIADGYTPPSDVEYLGVTYDPADVPSVARHDIAAVSVRYHLGTVSVEGRFVVVRPSTGPTETWAITSGGVLPYSVRSVLVPSITLGATSVATTTATTPTGSAFVGGYAVVMRQNVLLAPAPPAAFDIAPGADPVVFDLDHALVVRPEAIANINTFVRLGLSRCARETHLVLDIAECGTSYRGPLDRVAGVRWTITKLPVLTVALSTDPAKDGGQVVTTTMTPGTATATYTSGGSRHTLHVTITIKGVSQLQPDGSQLFTATG